ncbi:MacB family efflux pump subunit [Zavarzinia compransoris]|uniref:Macrolide ABC transporter permease/ATP-binding protein MacB n=1 Tax=Zavarzinia compransoris TaxID=1264899 RepID=A0A317E423_9PROT|nr:MacB family efflux pump subunit [Zavarzinia compransoris]PWR21868.1 macrolide ABC transporter permease/ATP-binding protein MacB [Zavarzinia compransoris]TDP45326.1 macrolide transport system ATP-binding/permease protein [Zavarzinia compransoris]
MGAPLIELEDIRKTYVSGGGEVSVEVLHGISLAIEAGEFVAIMGQSGSGKSTLMNILGCLDRPSAGRYRFAGRDVSEFDRDELAWARREAFGFVFQSYNLIGTATAAGNVEVPAVYAGLAPAARRHRAADLLTTLGLGERLGHRPNQLSGGQQQRVSIARALMNGGKVILADEPTGALDSRSGAEVMALLADLAEKGHTVIIITHDAEVAAHADRVIEIRDGLIVNDSRRRPVRPPAAFTLERPADSAARLLAGLGEAMLMALRSLRANLFRTVLTLLGIVIGVGSVVAMLAVGEGAKQSVLERISAMGTNLLLVRPGAPAQRGVGGQVVTLVPDDAVAIAGVENVLYALPELQSSLTLRAGNRDYQTSVTGTTNDLPATRDWPLAGGSFFSDEDNRSYATVVVLGRTVANNLFPDGSDPVGQFVLIGNVPFQVVGVMAAKGASPMGTDQDDVAFVPLQTGMLRLFGARNLRTITVAVADVGRIDETQVAVTDLLIERHRGQEDFQIRNMAAIVETASETQNTMTILLGSIAAISLLVGGIGVMNIMLVSVTERTREIGIRMATGARTRDIMQQFLTEAIVVSGLGGVIGVLGGVSVALIIQAVGMPIQFSGGVIMLAFGCAAMVGLVFGFAPAHKAARLDPVVALSSE